MVDHIGIKVANLDAAVRFYSAALERLGIVICSRDNSCAGFGPPGEPRLWLYADDATREGGVHLAFRADDRNAVEGFYAAALKAGGRDNGRPGIRADYSPNYYAAFVTDPDGNNIEAVCMR